MLCSEEKRLHLNICFSDFWRRREQETDKNLYFCLQKKTSTLPLSWSLCIFSLSLHCLLLNQTLFSHQKITKHLNWSLVKKKKKRNLTSSLLALRIPRCPEHYLCWCSDLLQYWSNSVSPCHSLTDPNITDHLRVRLDQSTPAEGRAVLFHRAVLTRQSRQFPIQIDKDLQSLNPIQDLT